MFDKTDKGLMYLNSSPNCVSGSNSISPPASVQLMSGGQYFAGRRSVLGGRVSIGNRPRTPRSPVAIYFFGKEGGEREREGGRRASFDTVSSLSSSCSYITWEILMR